MAVCRNYTLSTSFHDFGRLLLRRCPREGVSKDRMYTYFPTRSVFGPRRVDFRPPGGRPEGAGGRNQDCGPQATLCFVFDIRSPANTRNFLNFRLSKTTCSFRTETCGIYPVPPSGRRVAEKRHVADQALHALGAFPFFRIRSRGSPRKKQRLESMKLAETPHNLHTSFLDDCRFCCLGARWPERCFRSP